MTWVLQRRSIAFGVPCFFWGELGKDFCSISCQNGCQNDCRNGCRNECQNGSGKGRKMKFIHIADVHLGAEPDAGKAYSKRRPEELWESFVRVISLCEREQIDLLLIAGDLFHRQPLLRELKEVNALFAKLTHTQVVLIAGNHDYIRSDSYYLTFQWNENVHPLLGKNTQYVVLAQLDTAVYGFSYDRREIPEARYDGLQAQHKAEIEILLAHGGDEKHIPINRNMLRRSGFDYIAFGHIHKPQIVIKEMAAYAGALEPIDKNDTGRHGFIRGEIKNGETHLSFVPFAKREYLHPVLQVEKTMTARMVLDQIIETVQEYGEANLYKFILKGFRDPELCFEREWSEIAGNILEIVDETTPAYDFRKIYEENKNNLIGRFIRSFEGCTQESVEWQALCEGIQALMESRGERG